MITPHTLAEDVALALRCGTFGDAVRARLQRDLNHWDAQQTTPDAGRAFLRQWWTDHRFCIQVLAQLTIRQREALARSYIAYLKTFGPTELNEEQVQHRWDSEIARAQRTEADSQRLVVEHDPSTRSARLGNDYTITYSTSQVDV